MKTTNNQHTNAMQFKLLQPQARWISPKLKTLSISKIGTDSEQKHFSSEGFKFKDSFIKTFSKLSILQEVWAGGWRDWRVLTLETSGEAEAGLAARGES